MKIFPYSDSKHIHTINLPKNQTQSTYYQKLSTHPIWIRKLRNPKQVAIYLAKDSAPLFASTTAVEYDLEDFILKVSHNVFSGAQLYSNLSTILAKSSKNGADFAQEVVDFANLFGCSSVRIYSEKLTDLDLIKSGTGSKLAAPTPIPDRLDIRGDAGPPKANIAEPGPIEISVNYTNGSMSRFICTRCKNIFMLNQGILFKAIGGSILTCQNCKAEGTFKKFYDTQSAENSLRSPALEKDIFVAEILSPSHILELNELLSSEIQEFLQFDLLVVVGNIASQGSNNSTLKSIAEKALSIVQVSLDADIPTKPKDSRSNSVEIAFHSKSQPIGYPVNDKKSKSPAEPKKHNKQKYKEKASINHLVNFTLPPRAPPPSQTFAKKSFKRGNFIHFDREAFVLANFRFMLNFGQVNETIYTNPDFKLNWDDVNQVIVPSPGTLQCPICLEVPIASRITRCGHVFCYSCILRFFAENKRDKHLCPVCSFSIEDIELKRVTLWETHNKLVSSSKSNHIEMRLMRRDLDSIISLPASSPFWNHKRQLKGSAHTSLIPSSDSQPDVLAFSKIMWCSRSSIQISCHQEISDLSNFLKQNSLEPITKVFVEAALKKVNRDLDLSHNLPKSFEQNVQVKPNPGSSVSQSNGTPNPADSNKNHNNVQICGLDDPNTFIFYQSSDGQHLYLSPLDLRTIKESYSSTNYLPNMINVHVQHFDQITETLEYRKRVKMYGHIPLRCDITIVECDLSQNVTPEVLKQFEKQLKSRENRHKNQMIKSQAEDAKMALAAKMNHEKNQISAKAHPHHPIHSHLNTFNGIGIELDSSYYGNIFHSHSNADLDLVPVFGVNALQSEFPDLSGYNGHSQQDFNKGGVDGFNIPSGTDDHNQPGQSTKPTRNDQDFIPEKFPAINGSSFYGGHAASKHQASAKPNGFDVWKGGNYKKITQQGKSNTEKHFYSPQGGKGDTNFVDMSGVWAQIDKIATTNTNGIKSKKKQKPSTKISLTGNLSNARR